MQLVSLGKRVACVLVAFVIAAAGPSPAADSSYDRLQGLARDMTFHWAKLHPFVATELGIPGEDGMVDAPSQAADDRDLALIHTWEARPGWPRSSSPAHRPRCATMRPCCARS